MSFFSRPAIKTLTPAEVSELLGRGAIHLVDVREAHEWAQGHIPGAVHLPLSELSQRADELPEGKPVILYCLAGGRSGQALAWCNANGHEVEGHMGGGIGAWRAHGLPVVAD